MSRVISQSDIDALQDRATGADADRYARTLETWATDPESYELGPDVSRANLLVHAAEYYGYAERHDDEVRVLGDAIADGGTAFIDPRVLLVRALHDAGRADEAVGLSDDLRRERPTDPAAYTTLGLGFELAEDWSRAQRWYAMGLRAIGDGHAKGSEYDYESLLIGRKRVRENAGLPQDALDATAQAILDRH